MIEPKVVTVRSADHILMNKHTYRDSIAMIESQFTSRDVQVEKLDANKLANKKYMSMFKDGPKKYPKIFFFKNNYGAFMGLPDAIYDMIEEDEFDEEFEDCVGADKHIDVKKLEKEEAESYEKSLKLCICPIILDKIENIQSNCLFC